MTEVARTQGSSSDVERGEVPEVAALGNALKELFNRLGISQKQYAYRVHLDKSAVSRYLAGRRVAPQDFIDRLVQEIEDHLGAPLQLEAKEALRGRRLEALRVCSPDEFRLESLRDELARSRRDTERAHRNIEALHALLDKKEAEAQDVADDLTRLRLDWGAERSALARAQEDLLRQVAQLRQDLQDAEHLRAEAERYGEELRDTVLRLEEELSRTVPGGLPLEALKSRLLVLWDEEDFPGAARELTEAAWSRPPWEATELLYWLCETDAAVAAEAFAVDVARLRPLADVLETYPAVKEIGWAGMQEMWMSAVAARVTRSNAADVYQGLWRTDADGVLAEAVRRVESDADAVALVLAALSGQPDPAGLTELARVLASGRPGDRLGLRVMIGLAEAGRADVATRVLAVALKRVSYTDVARWMTDLRSEQVDVLFGLVTRLDDGLLMTMFTAHVRSEQALFERLLTTLARRDRLDALDLDSSKSLTQAVNRWRRSRGE